MSDKTTADVLGFTAQIISAHLTNNPLAPEALPVLIQSVYRSLVTVGEMEAKPEAQAPALPVTKSAFPEFIVRLEDGKKAQSPHRSENGQLAERMTNMLQNSVAMAPPRATV